MDVTVSHLNNRLALQLPSELPLGLVFVVGNVSELSQTQNGRSPHIQFALVEQAHRVQCVLSARAAGEVALRDGMTIRAGGHLAFEPQWAGYYLLVRDVEIVQAPPVTLPAAPPPTDSMLDRTAVAALLADIKKRSDAAHLTQADLPPWVQKIAPPEIQAEMEQELLDETAVPLTASLARPVIPPEINDDLIARLSAAMDSDDEVELTPEMLADLAAETELEMVEPEMVERNLPRPYDVPPPAELRQETAVSHPAEGWEDPDVYPPSVRRSDDYLIMLLIFTFIILAVLLVVAIVVLMWS
jgi:hypothetical protein